MTNLDAAKRAVGQNYPFDDKTYELGLEQAGLVPSDTYVPGEKFDLAVADLILYLIASANRISEGGYTVEIDTDALMKVRQALLDKWGVPDYSRPYLKDRTYLW